MCALAPVYVPRCLRFSYLRKQRKAVQAEVPLVPGYVFVAVSEPVVLRDSLGPNARGFLRNGDRSYAVLRTDAFLQLCDAEKQARLDALSRWEQRIRRENNPFDVGDSVRVLPLDAVGKIVKNTASSHVVEIGGRRIHVGFASRSKALEIVAA